MKKLISFLLVFISLFLFTSIVSADEPIEYKLAVLNAGHSVPRDHITVKRFRYLLDQLPKTYVENETQIADMTFNMRDMLREKGVEESLLNLMEGMNMLFSKPLGNQKYLEYGAAYVTLRANGYSHSKAISGLKAILESMGIY